MVEVKRHIKIVTQQRNIDKPPEMEGFPMKLWDIEIFLLDDQGEEHPAKCFTKAVYNLHPSFKNPIQTFHSPPFRCENEGWGEFDMTIDLYTSEKGGKQTIPHDLNFLQPRYENKQQVAFKNPSQALLAILRETGPVPGDENGARKKDGGDKKRKRPNVDMEKLADGLVKLGEEDLLHVVQMIHDNKSPETYTKNDVEQESSTSTCTLPDPLVKDLWDFVFNKSGIAA